MIRVEKQLVGFEQVVIMLSSWHIFDNTTSRLLTLFAILSSPSSKHCNVKFFLGNYHEQ